MGDGVTSVSLVFEKREITFNGFSASRNVGCGFTSKSVIPYRPVPVQFGYALAERSCRADVYGESVPFGDAYELLARYRSSG